MMKHEERLGKTLPPTPPQAGGTRPTSPGLERASVSPTLSQSIRCTHRPRGFRVPPACGGVGGLRSARQNQRGTALMFALMVMAILSIGTSVLWSQIHSQLAQQQQSWRKEQAIQLAEAGLEQAIAALRAAPGQYTGEAKVPLGPGSFTVTVTPGEGPGVFRIESWGELDFAAYRYDRAGLRAELKWSPSGTLERYSWQPIKGES